jgi:hypothetical protein
MSDLQTETKNDAEKTAAATEEPAKENMMTKVRMRVVHTKLFCQRLEAECGRCRGVCGKFCGLPQRKSVLNEEGSDPDRGSSPAMVMAREHHRLAMACRSKSHRNRAVRRSKG